MRENCKGILRLTLAATREFVAMSEIITATVDDGILRPDYPIRWSSGTKVRLTVEPYAASVGFRS